MYGMMSSIRACSNGVSLIARGRDRLHLPDPSRPEHHLPEPLHDLRQAPGPRPGHYPAPPVTGVTVADHDNERLRFAFLPIRLSMISPANP